MEAQVHSQNTLTVRTATSADVPLLVTLGMRTFYDTFAEVNTEADMDQYLAKNFNENQVRSELNDASNTFLLVESNGIPAGYAKLRTGTTPEELGDARAIELERLYVDKKFIGKRVGRFLMDSCLSRAKSEGYRILWLGVWERNYRAIAFYQKYGFKKFSSHPFLLGSDLQTDDMMKIDI